jgi:actin-like ATPase involved in cell morphogenesis
VPLVIQAILEILARAPTVLVDSLLEKIYLAGGGAAIPGLAQRIHAELKLKGLTGARVHMTKDPISVLASGALKHALLTPDAGWEVPLFAYRTAM